LGLSSKQPMHFCGSKAELFPLGENVFMPALHHLLNVFVQLANERGFTKKNYSLVTTPLVTWNFTNFTIFIFIFNTITCIRTIS
jgi:hypothetical protein